MRKAFWKASDQLTYGDARLGVNIDVDRWVAHFVYTWDRSKGRGWWSCCSASCDGELQAPGKILISMLYPKDDGQ